MTRNDRLAIARRAVTEHSQAEVARRIGKSPATISQVLAGTYPNPAAILELIASEFSPETISCPVMGEVPLSTCLDARRRAKMPFFASSRQTVELYRACPGCRHNGKGEP